MEDKKKEKEKVFTGRSFITIAVVLAILRLISGANPNAGDYLLVFGIYYVVKKLFIKFKHWKKNVPERREEV